jgi:hypothetical protein
LNNCAHEEAQKKESIHVKTQQLALEATAGQRRLVMLLLLVVAVVVIKMMIMNDGYPLAN